MGDLSDLHGLRGFRVASGTRDPTADAPTAPAAPPSMSADDLEAWVRGICKDAICESLAAAEEKIRAAVASKAVA